MTDALLPPATTPNLDPLDPPDAQHPSGHTLNALDYSDTPDYNGNGIVDPEDIIARFSNGVDDDHNGYTDDISGWDFYDNQNDPATVDSSYHHSDNQMQQEAAPTVFGDSRRRPSGSTARACLERTAHDLSLPPERIPSYATGQGFSRRSVAGTGTGHRAAPHRR